MMVTSAQIITSAKTGQPAYVQHQTAPAYSQTDADAMMMRAQEDHVDGIPF